MEHDVAWIEYKPDKVAQSRISELTDAENACNYYETDPGNRCMKEHLNLVRRGFEFDPTKALQREISFWKSKIESEKEKFGRL